MSARDEGLRSLAAAYEGFEDPADFAEPAALAAYREALLRRTEKQAAFLATQLEAGTHVFEAACGNGRLMIQLRLQGVISGGVGVDVARSRIAFATRWASDLGLDGLSFVTRDLADYEPPRARFDASLCVTGALAYFEPIARGLAFSIARRMRESLVPKGLVCLELYPHPGERHLLEASGGHIRTWSELPDGDPWRFYLSDLALDSDREVLTHEKTFIHRTDLRIDEGRCERLQLYTQEGIARLLRTAGFDDVRVYEGWSDRPYCGGETMVVFAQRT